MCSNVLPSAPQEEPRMYPELPQHDFRMQKANEVLKPGLNNIVKG